MEKRLYLNGKVAVSSLAAPTEEDLSVLNSLSDEEAKQLIDEVLTASEEEPDVDWSVESTMAKALGRANLAEHAV